MQAMDDMTLLREYAASNSEAAFAELVSRRIGFVYSAALRQVRDPHLAGEITQTVFIILAQKAGRISDKTILTGWLFRTTRFAALAQMRAEAKRSLRRATVEKEFQMQNEFQSPAVDETWNQMSPLLDEALARLGEKDRQAVLLRFFENKSLSEVGNSLGAGEDTARKRVSRALEKLHRYFSKRGVTSTTAIIAEKISTNSIQAAPVALTKSVTAVAIAKGAAASASTLTIIKGALKIMAWTKVKMAVVIGVSVLLAAGTTTVTIKEIQKHENETFQWQTNENLNSRWLEKAPPLLKIVPTKFPNGGGGIQIDYPNNNWKAMGLGWTIDDLVGSAYECRPGRGVFLTKLPDSRYDFIDTMPSEARKALQAEIKKQFDIFGRFKVLETNILLLMVKYPVSDGLKPSKNQMSYNGNNPGNISCTNQPLSTLADMLGAQFGIPVIEQTSLTNHYDFNLRWSEYGKKVGDSRPDYPNLEGLKHALLDQLGLELVPTNMPIEMLVVEKVK